MSGPVLSQRGLITWAVVGDVLDSSKPASRVVASIEGQDRVLYRVSPTLDANDSSTNAKKRLYKKFAEIPSDNVTIDAVNLCVNYRIGMGVLDEMKKRGIRYCFMQPGADHEEIVQKAEELGLVYQRGCMIVEPLLELDEDEKKIIDDQKQKLGIESASGCSCNIL